LAASMASRGVPEELAERILEALLSNTQTNDPERLRRRNAELSKLRETIHSGYEKFAKPEPSPTDDNSEPETGDESLIPADTLAAIKDTSKDTTNRRLYFVILALKAIGFSVERIVAVLERYPSGLAGKFFGALRPQVQSNWDKVPDVGPVTPPAPLPFINMGDWDTEPVPDQDWTILNLIPRPHTA